MRRFLPTGADALDLDESTSAGIGNWQDVGRGKGSRRRASQLPTSKRYAEDRSGPLLGTRGRSWQQWQKHCPGRPLQVAARSPGMTFG